MTESESQSFSLGGVACSAQKLLAQSAVCVCVKGAPAAAIFHPPVLQAMSRGRCYATRCMQHLCIWGCNELECHPDIYIHQVTRVVDTNDSRITQLRKQRRLMSSWSLNDMTVCPMRCLNQEVHSDPTDSASDGVSYKRSDSCTSRSCRRPCPQAWLLGRALLTSGLTSGLTSHSEHTG